MWSNYYNIHDLLNIQIIGQNRFKPGNDLKFNFFKNVQFINPDIVLKTGQFSPDNTNCQVVGGKYHIKENYIYYQESCGKANWEVEIFGFEEGKTEINFNGKWMSPSGMMLPSFWAQDILKPIIEYKLANKEFFLIHAGSVCTDSCAYIFAGRGGAGKTSLIMDFIRKDGFDFIGDERIIISKEKVLCFPMSLFAFDYAVRHLNTEDYTHIDKVRLWRKLLINGYESNISITREAKPASLFMIERKKSVNANTIELSLEEAITKLVVNNKLDLAGPSPVLVSSNFLHCMIAYSFVFPNSGIATYWDRLWKGLEDALGDVPKYLLELPLRYDKSTFENVSDFLKKT